MLGFLGVLTGTISFNNTFDPAYYCNQNRGKVFEIHSERAKYGRGYSGYYLHDEGKACQDKEGNAGLNYQYIGECGSNVGADYRYLNLEQGLLTGRIRGSDYRYSDLRTLNLAGADLSNSLFSCANLTGITLSTSSLENSDFTAANLQKALLNNLKSASTIIFRGADLSGAKLSNSSFSNVDLSFSNLGDTVIANANFSNSSFENAKLRDVAFFSSHFDNVSFKGADLRDSSFSSSDLSNANFEGADIRGADFSEAKLDFAKCDFGRDPKSKFDYCPFRGAKYNEETKLFRTDSFGSNNQMRRCVTEWFGMVRDSLSPNYQGYRFNCFRWQGITAEIFYPNPLLKCINSKGREGYNIGYLAGKEAECSDLTGMDLSGKDLRGVDFTGSRLTNVNFDGANLEGAIFEYTNDLYTSSFIGANLKNSNIFLPTRPDDSSKFNVTNFENANLEGAVIEFRIMESANFEGANLKNTILKGDAISNVNFKNANLSNAHIKVEKITSSNFTASNLNNTLFAITSCSWDRVSKLTDDYFLGSCLSRRPMSIEDSIFDGAEVSGTQILNVNFKNSNFTVQR